MMLEVRDLRSGYGRIPILHGVSLGVGERETVGVLGHNGMGKSTLIKTLMGALPATAGRIAFEDNDVTGIPSHRRARLGIGYVPQGREIFSNLSVRDNLRMGAAGAGADERAVIPEVLETLPRLKPLLDRIGGSLSGGEQQILAIGRTLCARPRLLLLDEPTEGVQPSIIDLIGDIFHELRDRQGLAMLLVEQNLDFIVDLCSRVLIMQKGKIVRELSRAEVDDPALIGEFFGGGS